MSIEAKNRFRIEIVLTKEELAIVDKIKKESMARTRAEVIRSAILMYSKTKERY